MRSTRTLLAAALPLLLLAAACGDDDEDVDAGGSGSTDGSGTPAPVPEGVTPGGGEGDLFLEISSAGGLVPRGFDFRNLPTLAVYGDGTVLAPGAITMQFPGPALFPVFEGQLDDAAMDELLAAAAASGMLDGPVDVGGMAEIPVADATTTRITVVVDGEEHVVEAYALSEAVDGPGLTDEQRAARAALGDLLVAASDAALAADEPRTPDRYRVLASAPNEAVDGVAPSELEWPAELPPPVEDTCVAITGDDAAALTPLLAEADELTNWHVGDATFSLAVRTVLPHEPDCPS